MRNSATTLQVIPVRNLHPSDVIICRHHGTLTAHQAENIRSKIQEKFPGFQVLVHDSRASIEILRPQAKAS